MVEQLIEKIIIDKIEAALADASIEGVQILGAWQPVTDAAADPKSIEEPGARGYISIKVGSRGYDKFLDAEGALDVRLELNMRAEADAKGGDYLAVTRIVCAVIQAWHRSFSVGEMDFNIPDKFLYTGFRMDAGLPGIDRTHCVWTWIQPFVITGIFQT